MAPTDCTGELLHLIRQIRRTKKALRIFEVQDGPDMERIIAAGEASGEIGPDTVIIRKFCFADDE
jgi:hypothetical protein